MNNIANINVRSKQSCSYITRKLSIPRHCAAFFGQSFFLPPFLFSLGKRGNYVSLKLRHVESSKKKRGEGSQPGQGRRKETVANKHQGFAKCWYWYLAYLERRACICSFLPTRVVSQQHGLKSWVLDNWGGSFVAARFLEEKMLGKLFCFLESWPHQHNFYFTRTIGPNVETGH